MDPNQIQPGHRYLVRVCHGTPPFASGEQVLAVEAVRHLTTGQVEVRHGKGQTASFRPEQFESEITEPPRIHGVAGDGTLISIGINTPGFCLASARCFQIWLALVDHAQAFGRGIRTADHAQETGHGLVVGSDGRAVPKPAGEAAVYGEWTVALLAQACGVNRNTATNALRELVDLGWLRMEKHRGDDGAYSGIRYWLLPPPSQLSGAARHRYRLQAGERMTKVREQNQRIRDTEQIGQQHDITSTEGAT